jgi:threonine dehydrogenase-like Zn-dependent dehydrogenase
MNRPALVLTGVDSFVVEQRPPAESTGDAVAIDVDLVGLCGTDLHIVEGSHPRARFPLVLGHELVGRATAGQLAGRAVVVDPLIACGDCSACRLGERHVCANLRLIGIDRDGGLVGASSWTRRVRRAGRIRSGGGRPGRAAGVVHAPVALTSSLATRS